MSERRLTGLFLGIQKRRFPQEAAFLYAFGWVWAQEPVNLGPAFGVDLTHNNIGSFSGRFIAVVKNQLKATSAYRLAQHTLSGQAVTQFKPCIGGEAAKRLGTAA